MIKKSTGLFLAIVIHFLVNELLLPTDYTIDQKWFALFYGLSFLLAFLLLKVSQWISANTKIQLGYSFMILSVIKLIGLSVFLILIIRKYELNKLSTIVHFVIPYYLASAWAVLKLLSLLKKEEAQSNSTKV